MTQGHKTPARKAVEEEDSELTPSHEYNKITTAEQMSVTKTGTYEKRSSTTTAIRKEPQPDR